MIQKNHSKKSRKECVQEHFTHSEIAWKDGGFRLPSHTLLCAHNSLTYFNIQFNFLPLYEMLDGLN